MWVGLRHTCCSGVSCRCNASSEHPPAGDSSSHPDSNSAGDATPSTSYQLPWEDEQPKQLPASYAAIKASIQKMDNNQLQTALGLAIAAEDYELAARWAASRYACLQQARERLLPPRPHE